MNGLLLSKAVSQWLLLPGILILFGFVGMLFWRRAWGRAVAALVLAMLWLFSTAPVADMLLEPLESHYPAYHADEARSSADTAIVLLGGGVYRHAPEFGGRDSLANDALSRTLYAAELAQKLGVPVYASGGRPLDPRAEPEGKVMVRWLVRMGVPATRAHAENMSNNTWQNAADLKPMLEKAGIRHIILVTSAYHMPRSVFCFTSQGMAVTPAPCAYHGRRGGYGYNLLSFLPQAHELAKADRALHEYVGLLWYHLRH